MTMRMKKKLLWILWQNGMSLKVLLISWKKNRKNMPWALFSFLNDTNWQLLLILMKILHWHYRSYNTRQAPTTIAKTLVKSQLRTNTSKFSDHQNLLLKAFEYPLWQRQNNTILGHISLGRAKETFQPYTMQLIANSFATGCSSKYYPVGGSKIHCLGTAYQQV